MTIIGEDAAPAPPHQIAIEKRGPDVVLSWPDLSQATMLNRIPSLDVPGTSEYPYYIFNRSRREVAIQASTDYEFFSLGDGFSTGIDE